MIKQRLEKSLIYKERLSLYKKRLTFYNFKARKKSY